MMSRNSESSAMQIENALERVSYDDMFMEIERRRLERKVRWPVESPGTLVKGLSVVLTTRILDYEESVVTTDTLYGSSKNLNRRTLVDYNRVRLPVDMSDDGIEEFFTDIYSYKDSQTIRAFGSIAINEPGMMVFKPIKTEFKTYFPTESVGRMIASEGLQAYINDTGALVGADESSQINHDMEKLFIAEDVYIGKLLDDTHAALVKRYSANK